MARINLLPWREELRRQKQNEFLTLLGLALIVALFLGVVVHFSYVRLIDYQNSRNNYLNAQIEIVNKKIEEIRALEDEKNRLIARMRSIEKLQGSRPFNVRLLDDLARRIPEGVSFTAVKQGGNTLTITGVAQSNARVSSLMRNLNSSEWLANPRLSLIESKDEPGSGGQGKQARRLSHFSLQIQQVQPKSESDEEGELAG